MFTKTTFCTIPWVSIQIYPTGDFKTCGFTGNDGNHGIGHDESGQVMNVLTHSIKDALNSSLHKEIRLAQSRNERHPACKTCWDKEDAHIANKRDGHKYEMGGETSGGYSFRIQRTFVNLPNQPGYVGVDDAASAMSEDGSIDGKIIHLDILLSNLCNAKCIHCDPAYSTMWYSDHIKLYGTNEFMVGSKRYHITQKDNKYVADIAKWYESPIWWEQFESIAPNLRSIYFNGGEPFLAPAHDEILDRLIVGGYASQIRLRYDTNLTVINNKILERLSHFKEVRLSISVDDIEDRYELIRYPGKWNRLLENLKILTSVERKNFTYQITTCIGVYDYYAPLRIIPLFTEMGFNNYSIRLLRTINYGKPEFYDMVYLPRHVKEKIVETYENSDLKREHKAVIVGYLKNNYDRSEQFCEFGMKTFFDRLDMLDKLRGTDWKKTIPELAEVLQSYR
jgi:MoaA/NifB/PqqE/SkfB family radical SAM enzyme